MNKAIFLDRDGTLNFDTGYVSKKEDLRLLDGVVKALKMFADSDYKLIVITNQSGIGRGFFTFEECEEFNRHLSEELLKSGVVIEEFFICQHSPSDNCSCRKPNPTMILEAAEKYNINLSESYMIGDKKSDVECGENANVASRLIDSDRDLLYWAVEITTKQL